MTSSSFNYPIVGCSLVCSSNLKFHIKCFPLRFNAFWRCPRQAPSKHSTTQVWQLQFKGEYVLRIPKSEKEANLLSKINFFNCQTLGYRFMRQHIHTMSLTEPCSKIACWPFSNHTKGHFTHKTRAVTTKLWERKRKCPNAPSRSCSVVTEPKV